MEVARDRCRHTARSMLNAMLNNGVVVVEELGIRTWFGELWKGLENGDVLWWLL
mgnify:FL=1